MIEDAQCRLVRLPPYAPDLDLMGIAFRQTKRWIQRHNHEFGKAIVRDERDLCFTYALSIVAIDSAKGFFRKCGYM